MSKYLKHHLKLGNRLLQTCEFSQILGVSLLFEYIGLQVDVPDSDRESNPPTVEAEPQFNYF